jgi:hypothetical protein
LAAALRRAAQYTHALLKLGQRNGASGLNLTHRSGTVVQFFLAQQTQPILESRDGEGGNRSPNTSTARPAVKGSPANRSGAQTPKPTARTRTHRALIREVSRLRTPPALASTPPVAEPSLAQVSTPIAAKPPLLEPLTPEQLLHNEKLVQLATLGFDPCVNESMLDDADGDVDKAAGLLYTAKAREEERVEALYLY